MKPRPFYRWKSFWLGLCVLVFLGWTWGAYFRKPLTACWGTTKAQYCLGWGGSSVAFVVNERAIYVGLEGSPPLGFYMFEETPFEPDEEVPVFAPALYRDTDRLGIWVGHWVLVAVFLVPWCAWLFRCWKREQKKLTT